MINSKSTLNLLTKLVETPSMYPNERKISGVVENELTKRGFKVVNQKVSEGRTNLFASKGKRGNILFYGHLDTVPVVNSEKWATNPFKLTVRGHKAYGLGASDMKGGISAFLEASTNSDAPVKIFLAIDEENISEGAWKAVSERKEFFKNVDLIISAEPSFGLGLNGITTSRTGRCLFDVTFKGRPEHIINYKNAVDSLKKLVNFGHDMYAKRDQIFKSRDSVAQLRKVSGESIGMSVCGEASAEIEMILGAEDNITSVLKKLQSLTSDKIEIKKRKTPYLEGYSFDHFPHKELISKIIKKSTGKAMKLHKRKSVGDDNVLATLKIPVLTWGAEGGNEHTANEYVVFGSLIILANMYKSLLDGAAKEK